MNLTIECENEQDGRWLAEVPQLPGVLVYGATAEEAKAKVERLALKSSLNFRRSIGGLRAAANPPYT